MTREDERAAAIEAMERLLNGMIDVAQKRSKRLTSDDIVMAAIGTLFAQRLALLPAPARVAILEGTAKYAETLCEIAATEAHVH